MISRASILGLATVVALAADLPSAAVRDTPALPMATARPLTLPVPGRLLVEAPPFGLAIVEHDGRIARLGNWYDAAWSPDGARVAATHGRTLAVLDETGTVRWIDRRPANAPPTQPDWAPDGRRLAYRSGRSLRVIADDGRRDRAVANGLQFAGPRWRPSTPGQLAWADRHGAVVVPASALIELPAAAQTLAAREARILAVARTPECTAERLIEVFNREDEIH